MKFINMKFINIKSTLISVVMVSLIIFASIFSLVGCNNSSSSTAGGNISGDISDSSQAGGGEQSEEDNSDVAKDLFNYKDIRFSLCDYTISFPRNWRVDSASGGMEVCGNMDMEQKQRDYFLVGGYSDRFMELPTSFDDIVEAFKPYLEKGLTSISLHYPDQTVEKSEEVEVNGRKMLKVEGRMKGENSNLWEEEKPTWDYKYYAYYTFIDANAPALKMDNCPIFWLGMTELEENYEIMEKYVDEAAKTMKNIER